MTNWLRILGLCSAMLIDGIVVSACTSAIISAKSSADNKPMLWKHRDSGFESNFVERIPATDSTYAYVALFNAGDSLLAEAWIGVNEHGFAIMNTASYNLVPDTATYKDREGFIMSEALRTCRTVNDFSLLLSNYHKPLGVQTNFGVVDANGDGAYFETDDYNFTKYNLHEAPEGVLFRTNFSLSGDSIGGYGYIRYANASDILADNIQQQNLAPEHFTEKASRSFYHSLTGRDAINDTCRWAVDQDFIPRHNSSASVVIEVKPDGKSVMWTALGYPPCAIVYPATIDSVPDCLRPTLPGYKSQAAETSISKKRKAFPITRGNGPKYIDMDYVRTEAAECHRQSMKNYERQ
ncbi:MAG: hypothetical protein K2J10_11405 [Muribaculaceae bacterium]|nr:hypothetical protein [Muribaculaceae bacterium]